MYDRRRELSARTIDRLLWGSYGRSRHNPGRARIRADGRTTAPEFGVSGPDAGSARCSASVLALSAQLSLKFPHQFRRGVLVALGLDQHIRKLAFGVDGATQIEMSVIGSRHEIGRDAR
jgi:hypothetical protein